MTVNLTQIQTQFGLFDYSDIESSIIDIRDIGLALAKINRFNGQTDIPFSVAQHSIFVTNLMELAGEPKNILKYGLLHDGHEAYYCDFPRPLKTYLKTHHGFDINSITDKADNFIFYKIFGLEPPTEKEKEIIKYYDNLALYNEKIYLFKREEKWGWSMPIIEQEDFNLYLQGNWQYWAEAIVNRSMLLNNTLTPLSIYQIGD